MARKFKPVGPSDRIAAAILDTIGLHDLLEPGTAAGVRSVKLDASVTAAPVLDLDLVVAGRDEAESWGRRIAGAILAHQDGESPATVNVNLWYMRECLRCDTTEQERGHHE